MSMWLRCTPPASELSGEYWNNPRESSGCQPCYIRIPSSSLKALFLGYFPGKQRPLSLKLKANTM